MIGALYFENPEGEIVVSKNMFYDSAGIVVSGGGQAQPISIVNNKFVSKPQHVQDDTFWIRVNAGYHIIKHNSFLDGSMAVGMLLGYGDQIYNFDVSDNYWNTVDPNQIADRVMDYNDDLKLGGPFIFEPFLTEPHPDTP